MCFATRVSAIEDPWHTHRSVADGFDAAELPPRRWPVVAIVGTVLVVGVAVIVAVAALSRDDAIGGGWPALASFAAYGLIPAAILFVVIPTAVAATFDHRRRRRELDVRATLRREPTPTATIVQPDTHAPTDAPATHALRTAFHRAMDPVQRRRVALGVAAHLRHHSAAHHPHRPIGYQFLLANGASAAFTDMAIGGARRSLLMHSDRVVQGFKQELGMIVRPPRVPDPAPWFSWPMTPREARRTLRQIEDGIEIAFVNRSTTVPAGVILLDPLAAPSTVPRHVIEAHWDQLRPETGNGLSESAPR